MKQINTHLESPIEWEKEMNKTITVEMTIGELINVAMSLSQITYAKIIDETKAVLDASIAFYQSIPECFSTYSDCIKIIEGNISVSEKKEEVW